MAWWRGVDHACTDGGDPSADRRPVSARHRRMPSQACRARRPAQGGAGPGAARRGEVRADHRRARRLTAGGGVVLDLLLIGLAITLEPFPLTAFILVLSAEKGIWKGLAFILGWLACLVVVIASVIAATQNNPPKPNTAPS